MPMTLNGPIFAKEEKLPMTFNVPINAKKKYC
jgi:hypothetical protein